MRCSRPVSRLAALLQRPAQSGQQQGLRLCPRCFGDDTGRQTLANVVEELRSQGKLPTSSFSSGPIFSTEPGPDGGPAGGFVNIDDDLIADLSPVRADAETLREDSVGSRGFEDEDEDATANSLVSQAAAARLARERSFEEAAALSEAELRERVQRSIEELVPADTANTVDEAELTPAQVFYLENRDRLVSRAQDYYLEKHRELQQSRDGDDVEDEWRYYHDPVVRPPKGHLWSTGMEGDGDEHGLENGWLEATATWPRGQLPSAELLADLLRAEQARDVSIVDLEECGRRDIGTFAVLGTGATPQHCRRLGHIVSRAVQACAVPHVEAFCWGARDDEWVVAHCGPIKVHLFTRQCREDYKLELLWRSPGEFFQFGDFPHYIEVYGTATEAMTLNGGTHVTQALGSRSRAAIPAPFRDSLHDDLMRADYEAAEDANFATPGNAGPIDVGSTRIVNTRSRSEAPWPSPVHDEELTDDESEPEEGSAEAQPASDPASDPTPLRRL
eukprot:TRINITY_DN45044_c0_g1_i1.p1 TRINITY_DN45044_c0_g1~~TRINITY_DN45044_c0_g1_i1.p1  ORF type:complete len:510 (+),score=82.79 TRINITY_DN45044_c0_g1_i1:24-1532(+)